ncbi:MAG: DUF2236 domain-containing protein [Nocardioides sp.]|nr:DUF2236 domain-containing protein [Nocardioides sp.]
MTGTPTRFREAEARGRAIARPLLLLTGTDRAVDPALMARLADGLLEGDALGDRVAAALRLRPGDPDRVTHAQVAAALASPTDLADDVPPALAAYVSALAEVPEWVDWTRVDRGAAAFQRLGTNANDVLLHLSLIGGYRFGGPTDLLVLTGALKGDGTLRRLAETQKWSIEATRPGGLRPGAEGWRLTAHVRVMHAMINALFGSQWDTDRFGLPINQADLAGTLGLFDATVILGVRALGVPLSRQERDDMMHLWRYVGWLMGVSPDLLTDDEAERHRINYHVLLAAAAQTQAGRDLARASVDAQAERHFGHPNALVERLHGAYARERTLSVLTAFVGVRGMRDLHLPPRPPWAVAASLVRNSVRYRLVGRVRGRRWLQSQGALAQGRVLASSFGALEHRVGSLPDASVSGDVAA